VLAKTLTPKSALKAGKRNE